MDFDLSEEQKMLRETVDRVLAAHIEPSRQSTQLDDAPPPSAALDGALRELSLAEVIVQSDAGKHGLDLLSLAVVAESMGLHAAHSPVVENVLAYWLLSKAGEAFSDVADAIGAGQKTACFALSDGAGQDLPEAWSFDPAEPSGRKSNVVWGAYSDFAIVGLAGGGLGLVATDAPGVARTAVPTLDRSRPVCDFEFEGAAIQRLPVGSDVVGAFFEALLILVAADACGAGYRVTEIAVEYAKERRQFDRPIGSFQGIKHQLANMALETMPNRPLVWYAAHLWDLGQPGASRTAYLTKAYVSDIAVKAGRLAVEVHGGIGYTWEYPLHVHLKRAMADRALFGLPATLQDRAMQMMQD